MLKKENYLDKRTGLTLSVVALAQVDTSKNTAVFLVGTSREAIQNGYIISKSTLSVEYDRTKNPYEQAYETAKGQRVEQRWNTETHKMEDVLVNQPFYDWEDLIEE